ncbi:MAG TPA: Druantia anti-phage system protein DruA, partial [Verrucomicrobiales bacterium]|nr:Druantia anti-phage system protein DruA [Verrucomicrobiales bacterium]
MKMPQPGQELHSRVKIRLMEESEREQFDELIEEKHYLRSSRIGGRHMRYVAAADGRWVGLLAFSGAAPHLKGREKWIGWSPRQRARRLALVVNNSRFLL